MNPIHKAAINAAIKFHTAELDYLLSVTEQGNTKDALEESKYALDNVYDEKRCIDCCEIDLREANESLNIAKAAYAEAVHHSMSMTKLRTQAKRQFHVSMNALLLASKAQEESLWTT